MKDKIASDIEIEIKIGNSTLDEVESVKYLGVIIDKRLKFDLHAEYILKK